MYNSTAEEIAKYFKITPRAVTDWAKKGYPIMVAGETKRIKLEGAQQIGTKLWRFNLKTVVNFIENLGDETWVSRNVHIPQRMAKQKLPKIGHTNSLFLGSDFSEALMARVLEQKRRPNRNASA